MKKCCVLLVMLVMLCVCVVPAMAMDVLVAGKWIDTGNDSLLNDGMGGEVQVRFDIPLDLKLGLSAGYERYAVSPMSERSRRGSTSLVGLIRDMPIGASVIKGFDLGNGCTIEAEGGVRYHLILDTDVYTTHTQTCGQWSRSKTKSEDDCEDFWTTFAGANLVVPFGGVKALLGGGYDWQRSWGGQDNQMRLNQGWFAKAGIVIPF